MLPVTPVPSEPAGLQQIAFVNGTDTYAPGKGRCVPRSSPHTEPGSCRIRSDAREQTARAMAICLSRSNPRRPARQRRCGKRVHVGCACAKQRPRTGVSLLWSVLSVNRVVVRLRRDGQPVVVLGPTFQLQRRHAHRGHPGHGPSLTGHSSFRRIEDLSPGMAQCLRLARLKHVDHVQDFWSNHVYGLSNGFIRSNCIKSPKSTARRCCGVFIPSASLQRDKEGGKGT
jgi:hypothetical protein